MGNELSVQEIREQQVVWALLPDPALERVFANMEMSTFLNVLNYIENEKVFEIACSNIVWKKRYENLYLQENVRKLAHVVYNGFYRGFTEDDEEENENNYRGIRVGTRDVTVKTDNYMTLASHKALFGLVLYHHKKRIRNTLRPHSYYFIQSVLIWSAFPHIWSIDGKTWSNVQYWVPVEIRNNKYYEIVSLNNEFYLNWREYFRLVPRCSWIEISTQAIYPFQYTNNTITIRKSDIPLCVKAFYFHDDGSLVWKRKYGDCKNNIAARVSLTYTVTRNETLSVTAKPPTLDSVRGEISLDYKSREVNKFTSTEQSDNIRIPYVIIGNLKDDFLVQFNLVSKRYFGKLKNDDSFILEPWMHVQPKNPLESDLLGCVVCAAPSPYVCEVCRTTAYCSVDCQRAHVNSGQHESCPFFQENKKNNTLKKNFKN